MLCSLASPPLSLIFLPSDCLIYIESFLPPLSLLSLEITCFTFRCRYPASFWERKYYQLNPNCKPNLSVPTEFYRSTIFDKFTEICTVVQGAFLGEYDKVPTPPTLPLSRSCNPYKTAVLLSSLGHPTQRCNICGLISYSNSSYLHPCSCSNVCVHRSCLEKKLNMKVHLPSCGICVDEGVNAAQQVYGRALNACCEVCGSVYRISFRLPESLTEILTCSLNDAAANKRFFSVTLIFSLLILTFMVGESLWKQNLTLPQFDDVPFLWWQMQQTTMLHIMFSMRFEEAIARMWGGPIFNFYCKLYLYFVAATVVLLLTTSSWPSRLGVLLVGDVKLSSLILPILKLMGVANFWTYFLMSHIIIVIFWRTNYRVYTIMDRGEMDGRAFDGGSGGVGVLGF